jgi:hypothetical protein
VDIPAFLTAVISVLPCDFVLLVAHKADEGKKYVLCCMGLFSLIGPYLDSDNSGCHPVLLERGKIGASCRVRITQCSLVDR